MTKDTITVQALERYATSFPADLEVYVNVDGELHTIPVDTFGVGGNPDPDILTIEAEPPADGDST